MFPLRDVLVLCFRSFQKKTTKNTFLNFCFRNSERTAGCDCVIRKVNEYGIDVRDKLVSIHYMGVIRDDFPNNRHFMCVINYIIFHLNDPSHTDKQRTPKQ